MQNTFAVVSCNDDAGAAPYATRPVSRCLTPHWDELAVFKDAAPSDRLHVSVLDRRLVGPHLLLGQVRCNWTCSAWLEIHLEMASINRNALPGSVWQSTQLLPLSSGLHPRVASPQPAVLMCSTEQATFTRVSWLEQVEVGVHEFADGRPHYAWLPLAGRAATGHMGGEVCNMLRLASDDSCSSPDVCYFEFTCHERCCLQVHLRLQWRENEREADAEATARFSFEVCPQNLASFPAQACLQQNSCRPSTC